MIEWNIYQVVACLSAFSVVVPLFFSIRAWPLGRVPKVIAVYLSVALVTEILNLAMIMSGAGNLEIGELFKLLEFIFVLFIFRLEKNHIVTSDPGFYVLVLLGVATYIADQVLNITILLNGFSHSVIILLSFVSFYQLLEKSSSEFTKDYFFWINSAFMLYFGASYFNFLFEGVTNQFKIELAQLLWTIHLTINVVYYFLLTIGLCRIKAS